VRNSVAYSVIYARTQRAAEFGSGRNILRSRCLYVIESYAQATPGRQVDHMSDTNALNRPDPSTHPMTGSTPADRSESWQEAATDAAVKTQEKARELGRTALEKAERSRHRTADALRGAADSIHRAADSRMGMDRVMDAAHRTADRIGNVADYVREHDSRQMMEDVGGFVRKYPGQSMLVAVAAGFLIGRAFRSSPED
jgi:ElaB/YqjD/DUF883 family membrane-anchored ribosome-binding protein